MYDRESREAKWIAIICFLVGVIMLLINPSSKVVLILVCSGILMCLSEMGRNIAAIREHIEKKQDM